MLAKETYLFSNNRPPEPCLSAADIEEGNQRHKRLTSLHKPNISHMQVTPYFTFAGNCEEALNFYAKAFHGQIKNLSRFEGSPAEGMDQDGQKVLHAQFCAKKLQFMASDSGDKDWKATGGNMVHLSIDFDEPGELEKVFKALSDGATITMPLQDTFWGARFGMLTDKFGISWMFNYDYKQE